MKLLIVLVMLVACGKKADEPDRWPEVERLATPTIPGGDGALLEEAFAKIDGDDITEAALDAATRWRQANGGLSWRNGRPMDSKQPLHAFRIGKALLERRASDPESVHTAQYLAHRLRAESPALLDVTIGFELAKLVVEGKHALRPELAPTEAELRRGIAADAVFAVRMVEEQKLDADMIARIRKDFAAMIVGAPHERGAFKKHVVAMVQKAEKDDVMSMLVMTRLPALVDDAYAVIDAYR